ncbi:hypothetical protein AN639_03500 [Candidatus Epulonipiscium fishelsonii]|uniref:Uncharacterized protein n=1 Tax=Candidatus Epulonipiscium fishelsonii TaxID=77094 RepID=A0ACC8XEN5_9FIRM|nr:hypothetical protein AN639_03500 [Epulopiscium sp. SCG-B05WGA-EpuloA1]ONI41757.1 hypothetical protein AN396_03235 [Epulopiscium sp. SCG-B11WGA-EpuloA1]
MRKLLAILFMAVLVVGYFMFTKYKYAEIDKEGKLTAVGMTKELKEVSLQLDEAYPQTPEELMHIYNNTIKYQYSELADYDTIVQSIDVMRKIYGEKLASLTTAEKQTANMWLTAQNYQIQKVINAGNEIRMVSYHDDNQADITVEHVFSDGSSAWQKYIFMLENGKWKLYTIQPTNQIPR